ncbi:MAG: GHMP kinase [Gammaproteobacteria bacterium]|nr:GHMP kinase [Gammaproteobacteria bacterium]
MSPSVSDRTGAILKCHSIIQDRYFHLIDRSSSNSQLPATVVEVHAPARLHMGFIDVSGVLGRRFGSIGVALSELGVSMRLTRSQQLNVKGFQQQRGLEYARQFLDAYEINHCVDIMIDQAIPEHAGLGSGTQLAMSIGMGLNRLFELQNSLEEIAALMGRGNRSGIGIGAFCQGGLVVDGGRASNTVIPPVISQLPIPANWRFILILDQSASGIHGDKEIQAFDQLPEFPAHLVEHLSYRLLMCGLPAVIEKDLPVFGSVISELQQCVGDHFAELQGGRFTSSAVEEAVQWFAAQGAVGLGQSSWGPTGFCIIDDHVAAQNMIDSANRQLRHLQLEFMLATASESGASVQTLDIPKDPCLQLTDYA